MWRARARLTCRRSGVQVPYRPPAYTATSYRHTGEPIPDPEIPGARPYRVQHGESLACHERIHHPILGQVDVREEPVVLVALLHVEREPHLGTNREEPRQGFLRRIAEWPLLFLGRVYGEEPYALVVAAECVAVGDALDRAGELLAGECSGVGGEADEQPCPTYDDRKARYVHCSGSRSQSRFQASKWKSSSMTASSSLACRAGCEFLSQAAPIVVQ